MDEGGSLGLRTRPVPVDRSIGGCEAIREWTHWGANGSGPAREAAS